MTSLPEDQSSSTVGEADRETAVRRVQEAYAGGHISHEEMDGRLHQALTARTRAELAVVLAPLPAQHPGTTSTIAAASGRIRRGGAWRVPRVLKVESAFGRVRLDLSRAVFEDRAVDIELRLGTGGARIIVPRDAVVEFGDLHTGWKDTRYRPPRRSGPGGPTVRILGSIGFGRLEIRHARR